MYRDTFPDGGYCIHITSVEQAEAVYDYYERVYGYEKSRNTSDAQNCMAFPYLIASFDHIGANSAKYNNECMEFPEWAEFVGVYNDDDFEFSPKGNLLDLLGVN